MSEKDMAHLRVVAQQLVERLGADPTFKTQVQQDPVAVLSGAGLPQEYVSTFLHETGLEEVAGYLSPNTTHYCLITCLLSNII
ncbi:hypothetical protein [Tengunoibacter tsumagoiensis]|uniref:Nif11 domain-containing protein n=1 Tax=Tengunoibacter tsumagoiensis TaxID=2014871 RepID=A0A402A6K3_9CHLR|nr:hypothetical protein [Tengunoibacter tsumagoiensis]GCE14645.1 hypothetical protein KTT_45040 [Tengunoibacter tsumagoiensis]